MNRQKGDKSMFNNFNGMCGAVAYRYKWFASSFESSLFGKYAANEITGFE